MDSLTISVYLGWLAGFLAFLASVPALRPGFPLGVAAGLLTSASDMMPDVGGLDSGLEDSAGDPFPGEQRADDPFRGAMSERMSESGAQRSFL
uniref:Putative secreted protein n=1 Tax=Ixodes ricinus TaxID=34613 RepID=A0A6B0U4R2_IXORI